MHSACRVREESSLLRKAGIVISENQVHVEKLRKRAEDKLEARHSQSVLADADPRRLVHELQVHQIELEMQNDALQDSHDLTLEALSRMSALKEQLDAVLLLRTAALDVARKEGKDESRFHAAILDNMPSGVLLTRASDQRIVFANPTLERIFGYNPGELIGKNIACLSPLGEKKQLRIGNSSAWTGDLRAMTKDGAEIGCGVSLSKFEHASFGPVWLFVYTDISSRLQLERELAEQKRLQLEVKEQLQRMEGLLLKSSVGLSHQPTATDESSLTRRQQQILRFVAEGLTSAQISSKLNISAATVMAHRRDIMRKLDLHSTAALTRYVIQGKAAAAK
jgi:PAS domain S-box-containing protein